MSKVRAHAGETLTEAQRALVEANLALVPFVLRRLHLAGEEMRDSLLSNEDLIAAGTLALCYAAQRYDPTVGVEAKFSSFAYHCIYGALLDELRKLTGYDRYRKHATPAPYYLHTVFSDGTDGDEELSLGSIIPDLDPLPDEQAVEAVCSSTLRSAVATLPERERAIIVNYYLAETPLSQHAIGMQIGVTTSRVSQIKARALQHLRTMPEIAAYGSGT